ncbi:MAG: cell surface protein SprA, partial [Gemmatimonadota bacterium]
MAENVLQRPPHPASSAGRRRPRRARWRDWTALVLALGVPAAASGPALRPPSLVGPLASLYWQPAPYGSIGRPGEPLLRYRNRSPLVEWQTPFAQKSVTIDSSGAHYTPQLAGFEAGPAITLSRREYVTLGQEYTYRNRWQETVRTAMRRTNLELARAGRSRLEWRVPFPAPKPLRRIIGDEGSLRINGSHTATISGKSQWTSGEVQTLAGRPSAFPTLSMDQESKFSVEGAIGDAINIRITQDTESLGQAFGSSLRDQLANQIKLDFRGDEDDIFQEVQAGNTTLALPSTRFVGFNQQHKGLFGIRASGHLGPVGFTTIASHEKSESNRQTFRGGAQVDTSSVRDYQYLHNLYFYLDEVYRARLSDYGEIATGTPGDYDPADDIDETSLQVFVNDFNVNNDAEQLAKEGKAVVDVTNPAESRTGFAESGTWQKLDPDNDYALVPQLGYIILRTAVQDRHALAVAYRTRGGRTVGRVVPGEPLLLKLLKARDARPDFPTWNLEWKNVYQIVRGFARGRMFEVDKIRIDILREVPGQEPQNSQGGKSYLQAMGLDVHGQDPASPPDRIIDADYVGLDPSRGHLIFPDRTPFDPQSLKYRNGLQVKVPDIYTKQQQRDLVEASQYIIQVVNSSAQQRINLSQGRLAGIDPESVDVRLNGKRLQPGIDYNVSFTGEVTFLGETESAVADPGADLEITYESQDLINLGSQQKTLLGLRGQYEFLDGEGMLGMTVLYNNVRSPDQRVRVGAEPARTVVWDMDLRARFDAPQLTALVDALPLLKTTAKSEVSVQAEVAQSRPNLNTRGAGYIDDFEGSERPELLSVFRTRWTPAATPEDFRLSPANRGHMIWFNPFDRILRAEIWPGQEDQYEVSNNKTDVLVMELAARAEGPPTWNGVTTVFAGGVRDFSQSKFLEIWVRGTEGELQLDLGDIAEDWRRRDLSRLDPGQVQGMSLRQRLDALLSGDGRLDTEDKPLPGRVTGDGQVATEEDVGIDGRSDDQELAFYLSLAGVDTAAFVTQDQRAAQFRAIREYAGRDPGDPEGDNWDYDPTRDKSNHERINGTEGNARRDESGSRPDSEDLNNDGNLNTRNDYFHYTIDLATDEPVPGTESNGWRLFRLPLYAPEPEVVRVGAPDSSRIESVRLVYAFGGVPGDTARVEIAQIEIIGNEWQEDEIAAWPGNEALGPGALGAEEAFNITVIGTDKNLEYSPPPGVHRRRLTQSRAREREQSLVLDYTELEAGHQASATKVLSQNGDYTKYTRLRMYVHGDSSGAYVIDPDSTDMEVFVRFGIDGSNYYEVATGVYPGWDERNEVDIDLLAISQLKERLLGRLQAGALDSLGRPLAVLDSLVTEDGLRDGEPLVYRVRGRPSMQQIKQLSVGVRNRGAGLREYSGEAWVDELRLDEARNDPGLAAYGRVSLKLADFMDVDGQVESSGQDFRTLSSTERKSSELKSGVTTTTNLHKFLPGSWGFSVPLKATYNRSLSLPRFGPNSDVELRAADQDSLRSESRKQFYEVSISKRRGQHWSTQWTIDQMNLRVSQTSERSISPVVPFDRKDNRTMSFSYKMPLPSATLQILGWMPGFVPQYFTGVKLRYVPSALDYSMNVNWQEAENWRATTSQQAEVRLYRGQAYQVGPELGDEQVLVSGRGDTLIVPRGETIAVDSGPTQATFDLRETYAAKANPLSALSTDYSLQINRDLRKKYDLGKLAFGREVGRNQNADVKLNLRWFQWLDHNYGFQASYEEVGDPRRRRAQTVIDTVTGRPAQTV